MCGDSQEHVYLFKAQWLLCLPFDLTLKYTAFLPRSVNVFRMIFIQNDDYFPKQH